jgi:hypothetical protein
MFALGLGPGVLSAQQKPTPLQPTTMLDLPTPPHQREVDVFFVGETVPAKPYLHLDYLAARKKGHDKPGTLIERLKTQAQGIGADGIIVWPPELKVETVVSGDWMVNSEVMDMSALAIVYPESLQFMPGLLKVWNVYTVDSTGQRWVLAASQPFDFKGNPKPLSGSRIWYDWWYEKTHHYLLEAPETKVGDAYGRLGSTLVRPERIRVRVMYETQYSKQIKMLRLSSEGRLLITIAYQYEEDKKTIKSREIRFGKKVADSFWEYPEYDAAGQVKGYLILKKTPEKSEQFLRVEFEYYGEEEWQAARQDLLASKLID